MTISLLQTKFNPPSAHLRTGRTHQVDRPRLLEKLRLAESGPLILVAAPAGFGKSTLLGAWVAQLTAESGLDCAWLALDPDDNDFLQFWRYVVTALQNVRPQVGGETLALLQTPQPPRPAAFLTPLLNELMDNPNQLLLVLDDYHLIEQRAIHQAMTYLIEHLPPQVHVAFSTRADPPLPLARWRAAGALLELRAEHLRFTRDEATTFLQEVMALPVATDAVAVLTARTEGWIAGLQLAALSLQRNADPDAFIAAFSGGNRFIVDYLGEEVLNQQPAMVRDFLLKTAVLQRLSGPLCDAVWGGPAEAGAESSAVDAMPPADLDGRLSDGQAILEYLEHANLFLVPLDSERRWYRYHHLFADLLRNRLEQRSPMELPRLHGLASVWYENQGLFVDAIRHALAASDYARAAPLVEAIGLSQFGQPAVQNALETWIAALPAALIEERPRLALLHGWLLFNRLQIVPALDHLASAAACAGADQAVQGEIAAVRVLVGAFRPGADPAAVAAWAEQALAHLGADRPAFRSIAAAGLAWVTLRRGDLARAEALYAESAAAARVADNVHLGLAASTSVAMIHYLRGALDQAHEAAQETLNWLAVQNAQQIPTAAGIHVILAELDLQRNNLAAAQSHVEQALRLSDQGVLSVLQLISRFASLRLLHAQGDLPAAWALWHTLHEETRQAGVAILQGALAGAAAQLHLAGGDLASAWQWAQGADWPETLAADAFQIFDLAYTLEHAQLARAQVFIAYARMNGDATLLADAIAFLERQVTLAARSGLLWLAIKANLLIALAHHARQQNVLAAAALTRATEMAAAQGFVCVFVDEGEAARLLIVDCRSAVVDEHARAYLDDLLVTLSAPLRTYEAQSHSQKIAPTGLVDPLSERELEVLALIADGLSNQEIAGQLVVAVSTVKKHINNIFSKLDATHRAQAVARARAAGLL